MQKKTFFFAGALVCLLATGWGFYQYQKPRAGTVGITPVYTLTAAQLYAEYTKNEAAAEKKYNNQVLQVSGVVKEVQASARTTNVLLDGGDAAGGVNCSFSESKYKQAVVGQPITVKGRCTGFLMDVGLVDAVRIDNN